MNVKKLIKTIENEHFNQKLHRINDIALGVELALRHVYDLVGYDALSPEWIEANQKTTLKGWINNG